MMRPADTEYRYHRLDHHMDQIRHDLELLLQNEQISQTDYDDAMKDVRSLHLTVVTAHRLWAQDHMSHRWFREGYDY